MSKLKATYRLFDSEATRKWGKKFAISLVNETNFITTGVTIYLSGDIGSGKTTLMQGFFLALGITEKITSPTFSLVNSYLAPPIYATHVDLYRLRNPSSVLALDIEDCLNKPYSVLAIEWPENGLEFIPPADCHITLKDYENSRILELALPNNNMISIFEKLGGDLV